MKCILLCAGYATRLFPLTENFPKALLKVGNKALLDYILEEVNSIKEVDSIFLVTNDKYSSHFSKWAEESNNIKPITVVNDGTLTNDDRLGAIGDILYTIEKENIDDDILIIAGDNLFTFKLNDFVSFYKTRQAPSVCVREESDINLLRRVGVAEVDSEMKIIGFEEKPAEPKSKYVAYAEYLYPKSVIPMFKQYMEEGNSNDAPGNFLAYLHKKLPTYAYSFSGECYDVGTIESLAYVNELYNNKN
ncbi:MAG: nucleotidyltransferase family protein [Clostridia bacterium]|nr:nucleotidyltransferase family protein [Clostridia bacterium]MDD4386637.1 nucleotidyltransferase family protein [Clostridia bacterium]